ncbi:MAG: putative ABC transporter ATP-binding protein [Candidatus Carbobacillus altaicus]|uniref:Putative ABC transporter ATP-binding protein n=1 Tax=Candidatus Carbonibacillus altaicus TaxID=2163959 RepID=A0A2R6XZM4_9BACL|nr:MAG: putative ABC transporter ATP-binding protein [Candidatus Carbobacillus altaicus]
MPKQTFASRVDWFGDGMSAVAYIRDKDKQIVIDEPPKPGGCISVLVSLLAKRHGADLRGVTIHGEGDLDPDGLFRKSSERPVSTGDRESTEGKIDDSSGSPTIKCLRLANSDSFGGPVMSEQSILSAENICKAYLAGDRPVVVLDNCSFNVFKGEMVSLLGPSGCGKSTLLNILGGFVRPNEGVVRFGLEVVTRPIRKCVMMFQGYALLPWRTALQNVLLGLEASSWPKKERLEIARHYLRLVGLEDMADRYPHQLSGGQRQRVALARSLAVHPDVLLMDEPFAALDAFTRYRLQDALMALQREIGMTVVLVTHDIDEAIYLSDRVLLMQGTPGRLVDELVVPLPKPRDRGSRAFQSYRERIFKAFALSDDVHDAADDPKPQTTGEWTAEKEEAFHRG